MLHVCIPSNLLKLFATYMHTSIISGTLCWLLLLNTHFGVDINVEISLWVACGTIKLGREFIVG